MNAILRDPMQFRSDLDAWRELEDASRALDTAAVHLDGGEGREVYRLLEEVDRLRAVVETRLFLELGLDARPPFGHTSPD